ncbi:Crp/Fnr family transcriptional regulator [Salmonella enterica]
MKRILNENLRDEYIRKYGLHSELPSSLVTALKLIKVNANEYLLKQNDDLKQIFLLVHGRVQIEHFDECGRHVIFSFESALSMLGDLEFLLKGQCRIYSTVRALSDAFLLTASVHIFEKYLSDPVFLRFCCYQLSNKLFHSSILNSNKANNAEYKLRRFLIFKTKTEGEFIQLEKRESLAAMLGISVRQLNRVLAKLCSDGIIILKNKSLRVLDEKRLADFNAVKI